MATQVGFCTEDEAKLTLDTDKVTRGVAYSASALAWHIKGATFAMVSILNGSEAFKALNVTPLTYTSGTYPELDWWCSAMVGELVRAAHGDAFDYVNSATILWCQDVRDGRADLA